MKIFIFVCALAAVLAALAIFGRSRVVPTRRVLVGQVGRVLEQLRASTADPAFAVFAFSTPDRPGADDALNVQFSLENGVAGLDWVLLAPRNIEDEQRFVEFARQLGFSPTRHEMNNVSYLRVEGGDIAQLCQLKLTAMYRVPSTTPVELIVGGFEWHP